MKFNLNEVVRIKSSGKVTEIKEYGTVTRKYLIYGRELKYFLWITEDELEKLYTFDDEFESNFIDLLIHTHLGERNYDMIKSLYEQKQNYIKEEGGS